MESAPEQEAFQWQVGVWDRISQLYLCEIDPRFAPVVGGVIRRAGLKPGEGAEEEGLKTTQAILDSMTREERLSPHLINGSRKKRIARGSGTHVQDVNKVLKQHAQMRRMMRAMTRRGRRGGAPPGLPFPFR